MIKPLVVGLSLLTNIGYNHDYRPSPDYFKIPQSRPVERPIEKPKGLDIFGLPNFDEECPGGIGEYERTIKQIQEDFDEINKSIDSLEKLLDSEKNSKRK